MVELYQIPLPKAMGKPTRIAACPIMVEVKNLDACPLQLNQNIVGDQITRDKSHLM
jgi:hypothetical protein